MSDPSPLAFATIPELFHELCSRSEAVLLVRTFPTDEREGHEQTDTHVYYCGGVPYALGLCEYARNKLCDGTPDTPEPEDTP